jgi:hypothetical protein
MFLPIRVVDCYVSQMEYQLKIKEILILPGVILIGRDIVVTIHKKCLLKNAKSIVR